MVKLLTISLITIFQFTNEYLGYICASLASALSLIID